MKSIWYLVNLAKKQVVESYEGGDTMPVDAVVDARSFADSTGDTHALAHGKHFFQSEGPRAAEGATGPKGPTGSFDEPELTREDLEAEHEAMRVTMLNMLMKIGVLDEHSARAPWDGPTLLHFAGMFLTDALPWARNQGYMKTLQVAVNRIGKDLDELKRHVDEINETCWAKAIDERLQALKDELANVEPLSKLNEANVVDLMHRVESLESKVKE